MDEQSIIELAESSAATLVGSRMYLNTANTGIVAVVAQASFSDTGSVFQTNYPSVAGATLLVRTTSGVVSLVNTVFDNGQGGTGAIYFDCAKGGLQCLNVTFSNNEGSSCAYGGAVYLQAAGSIYNPE